MEYVARRVGWGVVYVARRMLVGTPVQKWNITSKLYARLMDLMYAHKDISVTYKNVNLILPPKDPSIVPPIIRGTYESFELDVYRRLAPKTEVIFDVGANIGLYAAVAGKENPRAKIISFEPVDENIVYLKKNIEANLLTNVEIIEAAVGEKAGKIEMFLSDISIGHHSAVADERDRRSGRSVVVPVVSIDDYVASTGLAPNLLKVDVEGFDIFVFKGARETLNKYKPTIFAEYGPDMMKRQGYEPKEFLDLLFKASKKAFIFDEKNEVLIPTTKKALLRNDDHSVSNLIFVSDPSHLKCLKDLVRP